MFNQLFFEFSTVKFSLEEPQEFLKLSMMEPPPKLVTQLFILLDLLKGVVGIVLLLIEDEVSWVATN